MADSLKSRIRAHTCDRCDAGSFGERLSALVDRIEADFEGEWQERLLTLAQDAFDRHLRMRAESTRVRKALAALDSDQRRLLELLDFLNARREGTSLH
jgi:hypothetical protein